MRTIFSFLLLLLFCPAYSQNYAFEENKGQWHPEVLFRTHIPGGYLFITQTGMKYLYLHPEDMEKYHGHNHTTDTKSNLRAAPPENTGVRMQAIAVNFENIAADVQIEKKKAHPSHSNYFLGNDPSTHTTDVKKYEEISIKNIYPGIDLKFYSEQDHLKYDLIVAPNADPSQIIMNYEGASTIQLADGRLEVETDFGKTLELQPITFQQKNNSRKAIPCEYILKDSSVSFHFPKGFDKKIPLIIDPALIFSTYSGSLADNWGFTATFDDEGNLYSGGIAFSTGFPTTTGAFQWNFEGEIDVAILKFDSLGRNLLYATYLGGNGADTPHSLIVDHNGDLVIFGTTSSSDFPVSPTGYQKAFLGGSFMNPVGGVFYANGSDMFISKLSADGTKLNASSYMGGSANDGVMLANDTLTQNYGDQFRGEVNVDGDNNVYICSYTASSDFPVENGFQGTFGGGPYDGIVTKMNPDLSQITWSTYLGGNGADGLYSIKIDKDKNVYVAGGTTSPNYPTSLDALFPGKTAEDIDGVVSKIKHDGSEIIRSTFLHTPEYDQVYFIDIDSSQNVYALGQTQGEYPVSDNVYSNPNSGQFIHKLGPGLDTTFYSTVFGSGSGSPDIRPTAFLVNECENLLISGWGGNNNFPYIGGNTLNMPITDDAFQKTTDGSDFYLMVLLQDARQLLYATHFGEFNLRGDHVDGGTSRFDKRGIVYQSTCASCGGTNGFPVTENAYSAQNNSLNCNNAVFKFDLSQLQALLDTDSKEFDNPGITSGCWPLDIVFLNKSIGGVDFEWNFGNGETSTQKDSILITYEHPGVYNVSLRATDIATCVREDFDYGTITVYDQNFSIMAPRKICHGSSIELNAEGGVSYRWSPAEYLANANSKNPVARPDTTLYFHVEITNEHGCVHRDSVLITVVPEFTADFSFAKQNSCTETPNVIFSNLSEGVESFTWNLGDGTTLEDTDPIHNYHQNDTFTVHLKATLDICEKNKELQVTSMKTVIPNIITPNGDGKNDTFQVITAEPVDIKIFNRWGKTVYKKEYYANEFNGKDLATGVYYYEVVFREDNTSCNGWLHVLR